MNGWINDGWVMEGEIENGYIKFRWMNTKLLCGYYLGSGMIRRYPSLLFHIFKNSLTPEHWTGIIL